MANGTDLGKAYVQIIPSAEGITGRIQNILDPEGQKAGASMGGKIVGFAKKAFIAGAIGKVVKDSLYEGGKLQQSIGGIETLFKDNSDKVRENASQAFRTVGVSANEYMENVTSFSASLLQSLGGDTGKAADVANMAMIDMGDNANKMGTSMESIQNAYQGFAKQNYTMLDNLKLGYSGTKQEMERLLSDAEKLTGVKYDINNLSDVYEAIHAVQEELGITGTTATEASATLTGSFAAMGAAFKDLLGNIALGENVAESLHNLGETVGTFVFENLIPMLGNIVMSIPTLVLGFFTEFMPAMLEKGGELISNLATGIIEGWPEFKEKLDQVWENVKTFFTEKLPEFLEKGKEFIVNIATGFFENLPEWIDKLTEFIKQTVDYLVENLPEFIKKGGEFVVNLVTGFVEKIPEFVTKLGEFIGKAVAYLGENLPKFVLKGGEIILHLIKGLVSYIPKVILTLGELTLKMIGKLLESIPKFLKAGVDFLANLLKGILSGVAGLLSNVGNIAKQVLDTIKAAFTGIIQIGKDLIKGLWEGISSMATWVVDKVKGIGKSIIGGFKSVLGIKSPSTVFADFGKNINLGLAQGIEDNLRPISNAMDKMQDETIRDFDTDVMYNVGSSYKSGANSNSLPFSNPEAKKKPLELNLILAGKNFKAFVEDISDVQNKKIELELAY